LLPSPGQVTPVLKHDFENSVGYWITITQQAYHRTFSDRLAPLGITYRQMQVLGWLALDGRLTQAELAARMFIEPPSLVGVLDRMEQSGWIRRTPCSEDRRKKWITACPAARPAWRKIVACGRKLRQQATDGFTPAELATLHDLLSRVRANVTDAEVVRESKTQKAKKVKRQRTGVLSNGR